MGKIRLKADCGTSYLRLGAELDIDVPGDSPEAVKAAAAPMLDALRDACEDGLSRYRAELAGDFARKVPEFEHRLHGCDSCPAPAGTSGAGGTIEPEPPAEKVKPERCADCGRLNTSERVIEYSRAHFNGAVLCTTCQELRRKAGTPVASGNGTTF